jgi:hypothetical protein
MYIFSFNTDPAISDLAVGIDVPAVQYDSLDEDDEKAVRKIEDDKIITATRNKITVEATFNSYLDNQQSKLYSCFLLNYFRLCIMVKNNGWIMLKLDRKYEDNNNF